MNGKRYVVGLFSSSDPTLSAVCVFKENEIYEAFLESRRHRHGCPLGKLPAEDIFEAEGREIQCVSYTDLNKTNEVC